MKKHIPIFIYGAIVILTGVFLLNSQYIVFNSIRLALGITLSLAAISAFIAAFSRQWKQVQFAYHEMHAMAMFAYGLAVLVFGNSLERVISFTAFLLFFYGFSEIIFSAWLFNLGQNLNFKVLFARLFFGLTISIDTVVAMYFSDSTFQFFAALFILIGVNIMLYVPIMKENQSKSINEIIS